MFRGVINKITQAHAFWNTEYIIAPGLISNELAAANTPFPRGSTHEANMKQTYSKYTCTTCAVSLLHVCFIV